MTFYEREAADGVAPVELVTFARGQGPSARVWHYCTGDVPVTYAGITYRPAALTREAIRRDQSTSRTSVVLTLATSTPFVAEWLAQDAVTARGVTAVTIMRVHLTSAGTVDGLASQPTGARFLASFAGMDVSGETTRVSCDGIGSRFERTVPRVPIARTCPWSVYDKRCGISPDLFQRGGTVDSVGPNTVPGILVGTTMLTLTMGGTVPLGLGAVPDATFFHGGVLLWTVGSERRSISIASGSLSAWPTVLLGTDDVVDAAIVGDAVNVWPGCEKTKGVCESRFDNLTHFGGFPRMPDRNPLLYGLE